MFYHQFVVPHTQTARLEYKIPHLKLFDSILKQSSIGEVSDSLSSISTFNYCVQKSKESVHLKVEEYLREQTNFFFQYLICRWIVLRKAKEGNIQCKGRWKERSLEFHFLNSDFILNFV